MCEPVTLSIATAASAGIGIAGKIMQHNAQNAMAEANEEYANAAASLQISQIYEQQKQLRERSARSSFYNDLEARRASGLTAVSAAESGVGGASVDLILNDIERNRLIARTEEEVNLENYSRQAAYDRLGVEAQRRNRINSVPRSNPWALAFGIGGNVAEAATAVGGHYGRLPRIGGSGGNR